MLSKQKLELRVTEQMRIIFCITQKNVKMLAHYTTVLSEAELWLDEIFIKQKI